MYWKYPDWRTSQIVDAARGDVPLMMSYNGMLAYNGMTTTVESADMNESQRRMIIWRALAGVLCDYPLEGMRAIFTSFFASGSTKINNVDDDHGLDHEHDDTQCVICYYSAIISRGTNALKLPYYETNGCRVNWTKRMKVMRRVAMYCSMENLERLRDTAASIFGTGAFILQRITDESERSFRCARRSLISQIATKLRAILKTTLTKHHVKIFGHGLKSIPCIPQYDAVVGWADEMLADICLGQEIRELMWAKKCWFREGRELVFHKKNNRRGYDTNEILKLIMKNNDNDFENDFKKEVREARGDDLHMQKIQTNWAYHEVFEDYASSSAKCFRFNGFNVRTVNKGRMAVYLAGFLTC
jgi:hypothetical protein